MFKLVLGFMIGSFCKKIIAFLNGSLNGDWF